MRVDLFDYELPKGRIALRPAQPRDAARLLVVTPPKEADSEAAKGSGWLVDAHVLDLPKYLKRGDVLVLNDTRVLPARLAGIRTRDGNTAHVELTLHQRDAADCWRALAHPAKRLRAGDRVAFSDTLQAEVLAREAGEVVLRFNRQGAALDAAVEAVGLMPLPPYIASRRPPDARDRLDYQTAYARTPGAVAAPTAGLHFTDRLFSALDAAGVHRVMLTLHVGAGTFLPIQGEDMKVHQMHSEWGTLSPGTADTLNRVRKAGGRLVAVGTTSLRFLETAAREDGVIEPFTGETDLFITPGYRFKAADALITNFHLPRSTLFMLVCAFAGLETMKGAYAHAIEAGYRFYSYGDACLLFPGQSR